MKRNVREMESSEIDLVINYFLKADDAFLKKMGVDKKKLPGFNQWQQLFLEDLKKPPEQKHSFCLMWELDGKPVGHSNINKIQYGHEAYIHLHLWEKVKRKSGHGLYFIKKSLQHYFERFNLKMLISEPYALNPGPNRTLSKAGFEFIKNYKTRPGWINLYQSVNRYVLTREYFFKNLEFYHRD